MRIGKQEFETFYSSHTIRETMAYFKISQSRTYSIFQEFCVEPRRHSAASIKMWKEKRSHAPELNGNWKGGRVYDAHGYVMIYQPQHPRALGPYVYEHILVWEKQNGLAVPKDFVVHHLNGIRDDNRIENLTIVPRKHHDTWTLVKKLQERILQLESELKRKEEKPCG